MGERNNRKARNLDEAPRSGESSSADGNGKPKLKLRAYEEHLCKLHVELVKL